MQKIYLLYVLHYFQFKRSPLHSKHLSTLCQKCWSHVDTYVYAVKRRINIDKSSSRTKTWCDARETPPVRRAMHKNTTKREVRRNAAAYYYTHKCVFFFPEAIDPWKPPPPLSLSRRLNTVDSKFELNYSVFTRM